MEKTCEIYGDGTQTRDFIYIEDLIGAIVKAAEANVGGETFQIATSKEHTVNEVAKILEQELKRHKIDLKIVYSEPRLGDVKRNFSDTSKAKKTLDWWAKTTLNQGIQRTVKWFLNHSVH